MLAWDITQYLHSNVIHAPVVTYFLSPEVDDESLPLLYYIEVYLMPYPACYRYIRIESIRGFSTSPFRTRANKRKMLLEVNVKGLIYFAMRRQ